MNKTLVYWPSAVECPECRFLQQAEGWDIDARGPYLTLTEHHSSECSRYVNNSLKSRLNPPKLVIENGEWNHS